MPDAGAASQVKRTPDFGRYLPEFPRSKNARRLTGGGLLALAVCALALAALLLSSSPQPAQAQSGPNKVWSATMNAGSGHRDSNQIGKGTGSRDTGVRFFEPPRAAIYLIAGQAVTGGGQDGNAITEGGQAFFTLVAQPAPLSDLKVDLDVQQQGDFGVATGRKDGAVIIPKGENFVWYHVATQNDEVDEPHGEVVVRLLPRLHRWDEDPFSGKPVFVEGYSAKENVRRYATVPVQDDDGTGPVVRLRVVNEKNPDNWGHRHKVTEGKTDEGLDKKVEFELTTEDGSPVTFTTPGDGVNVQYTLTGGNFVVSSPNIANLDSTPRIHGSRSLAATTGLTHTFTILDDDVVQQPHSARLTATLLPGNNYQLPDDPWQRVAFVHIYDNDAPPSPQPFIFWRALEGKSRVRVNWEPVPGATAYDVRWGPAGESARQTERVRAPEYTTPDLSPGVAHAFQVTACNDAGCGPPSPEVQGSVSAQTRANAGPDLTGAPGETVTLQGRDSHNPYGKWYQLAHAWKQTDGPEVTLDGVNRGDPSFTIPADAAYGTTYTFTLTVTDQEGVSASDETTVTVAPPAPTPPTACAGEDLEAQPGDTVTLQGICSTNPHGVWWRLAHLWTQPAGQNIVLSDATKGKPMFTLPADAAPGTTYTFTLTVTDKDGESDSDSMTVTVPGGTGDSQTADPPPAPNGAPTFNAGSGTTRSIPENSPAGTSVGAAFTATDPDSDPLTYALSGTDAASFAIDEDSGQITTKSGVTYDYETKASYEVTVEASDGNGGAASIAVTVTLTNVDETPPNQAPVFDDGSETTRSIAENTAAGTNVGAAITATDPDTGDTLKYSLSGTDAASFAIDEDSGQLTTKSGVTYDYETKASYEVTVTADDGNGGAASIAVTVTLTNVDETPPNQAPVFDDGSETTRSIAENTAAGTNVGAAITATDPDTGDTLKYSLSGTDAASFAIDEDSGQLTTKSGVTYDYETKASYEVTVTADDGNGGAASIAVTVTLTNVDETPPNQAPVFDDGSETTRSIAENTAAGTNVGAAITATDPDTGDTLKYSLSGTDAASFAIDEDSGQLTTKSGVTYDYETKASYEVTVTADDGNGGTASIAVTVNLGNVHEPTPVTDCFTDLGALSAAAEYAGSWDDGECKAHHQDSPGRYFQFTLAVETVVTITLASESDRALFVSRDMPQNGWGTEPRSTYEDRRRIRRDNGKLMHDGPHTGSNTVTLTLAAGVTYTMEAAGTADDGTFTISFAPQ